MDYTLRSQTSLDMDWISRLAIDIIDINCCECSEFVESLSTSKCWCDDIKDLVDRELSELNQYVDEHDEEAISNEWERIRKSMIGDD
jgi:hypothetical protein